MLVRPTRLLGREASAWRSNFVRGLYAIVRTLPGVYACLYSSRDVALVHCAFSTSLGDFHTIYDQPFGISARGVFISLITWDASMIFLFYDWTATRKLE